MAATDPGAADAIVRAGRRMDLRGWVPATAGNLSLRLPNGIAITGSGCHKGALAPGDVMLVDAAGAPRGPGRPSAETLLHCQIYRRVPDAGAVLHGHSVAATVLSMIEPSDHLAFEGHEIQKALPGQPTHLGRLALPLVDNDQDMARLCGRVETLLAPDAPGYLIRGHGLYAWGPDMDAAMARLEGLEFLLACELERRKLRA